MQSIITLASGYASLKHSGIFSITLPLAHHIGTQPNLKQIKFAHVIMYLKAVDLDKLKSQAVYFSISVVNQVLTMTKTKRNCADS